MGGGLKTQGLRGADSCFLHFVNHYLAILVLTSNTLFINAFCFLIDERKLFSETFTPRVHIVFSEFVQ